MQPRAIIIGSGFSSLSAACYLARGGYDVTMLEKNSHPGGRARQLRSGDFIFDMGPTWYWMPDIFENFFADFNQQPSDYYQLRRLDPSYGVYFSKDEYEPIPASKEGLDALFEKYQPGSSILLQQFLAEAEMTYSLAVTQMAFKPGHSPFEFISSKTIAHLPLFIQTLRQKVRSKFKHPYLISLLEFPVLFLGAKPGNTPAFYNFMNYADLVLGTWYPDGGMYSVVNGMVSLSKELGVKLITDCEVLGFNQDAKRINEVTTSIGNFAADIFVSGADYHHTESLLEGKDRNYSESYWDKRTFAPSTLLFYIGLNKKLKNVHHHTLFFDTSFDVHAQSIYDIPSWPEDPLFYVNIASITDPVVAPVGQECMTILVPIAPGIADTAEIRQMYFEKIIRRMESITGNEIEKHIIVKHSYCINDFEQDYNAYKGNAYGMANTLFQTGYFRPSIQNKKIKNLYYTGQLTVPGGGVPPAIMSGKIVATEILKKNKRYEWAT
ncbi:MAG: phytoene desaturase family protein [Bacteroidota bacterium]|nr:phytoene desaturase family protein [Bacteroidota bacterium]